MHAEFEVHILNPDGIAKAKQIAQAFDELLTKLDGLAECKDGLSTSYFGVQPRSYAIVKTKLEEASFFAKKAMASLPENQLQPVEVPVDVQS